MRVDIAICAFKRPAIRDTLDSVARQSLPEGLALRVIVAENDETPALRDLIEDHARTLGLDLHYVHAPARNISIARNACLDAAEGELLLFIDDDEEAEPDWVRRLVGAWEETGAGAIFGPALAIYPPTAPAWMRENAFHSNIPTRKGDVVETGFSSNVLLDMTDPRVREMRFDRVFGRTGGEDVDFFFRLHRAGVLMAIAEDAIVREPVAEKRMSFGWVLRRRHMTGAIYGACVAPEAPAKRMTVLFKSLIKAAYCGLRALAAVFDRTRCAFWTMRGSFHMGVISGCIARPRREIYGGTP